ncbi:MAG: ribosome small subunit-dependent GTPase A [Bacteroidia bacterium]|nr:ribosome small subunit-dependent GTPase A [Bacteroidia bacterium]
MKGIVIKSTGSWYKIRQEDLTVIDARIKGKIRLKDIDTTNPVAVGDIVFYEFESSGDITNGVITEVEKRHNYIIRKSNKLSKQGQIIAANVDLALLVVTLSNPRTSLGFIDRFLVMAGAYHIPVGLVFNKCDLYTEADKDNYDYLQFSYGHLGYPCILTSTVLEEYNPTHQLIDIIKGKKVLISGHSGVGKSSILNRLLPDAFQKVEKISDSHQKGKHTTTFAEMFYLDNDTALIDTPGIRDFGIIDIDESEIGHYFPEIRALMPQCRFYNCKHLNEPDCAVIKAYQENKIAPERYESYLSILRNENMFA